MINEQQAERRAPYNPFDNQAFRQELTELLEEKLGPMKALAKKVEEHETSIQRTRGALWAIGGLSATILAAIEWLHQLGKKAPHP